MGKLSRRKQQLALARGNNKPPPPDPLPVHHVEELKEFGYTMFHYAKSGRTNISEESMEQIVSDIHSFGGYLFNNGKTDRQGGIGDKTRMQWIREWDALPGRAAKVVSNRLLTTFPFLKLGLAQFLLSEENGHDQRPHTDTEAGGDLLHKPEVQALKENIDQGKSPLSVIVTFGDPAQLIIWPSSMNVIWAVSGTEPKKIGQGIRVHIPQFTALVFRQDLVHAGSSYSKTNVRLHFFMDLIDPRCRQLDNATSLVDARYFRKPPKTAFQNKEELRAPARKKQRKIQTQE